MIGSNGPLYYYFWKYFPLAQSFRIPGRTGLILPFLLFLLLAWLARCKPLVFQIRGRNMSLSPLAVAATAGLLLFVLLNIFSLEVFNLDEGYVPVNILKIPEIAITLFIALGVLSLVALFVSTIKNRIGLLGSVVLILAVVFQTGLMLRYGTRFKRGPRKTITLEHMQVQQQEQVGYRENSGEWSRFEVNRHLSQTFIEPSLARICRKYTVVDSIEKAYRNMSAGRAIDHVFIENYPVTDKRTVPKTLDGEDVDQINLNYNSFNNLRFDVTSSQPGFFVFSLPSNRWKAYINGKSATVYRANAIERTIWLEAGNNNVEFRYWSRAAVIGTVISCVILFFLSQYLIGSIRSKVFRRSAIFIMLCICISVFIIWYHSLYWGGHIGTNYNWTSKDIQPHLLSTHNLAYGKKSYMGTRARRRYLHAASRGTDGDRVPDHGFATNQGKNAWWQLDLGKAEPITEIVLYKHRNKSTLPFDICVSPDGRRWFLIKTITNNSPEAYWYIKCSNVRARYIRIQTRKPGRLFLSEVEVYGPKHSFEEANLKWN